MNRLVGKKGFTLIELLVVITIIGILTAIGAVSFRSTNMKARDGRRQADLEQIRAALEIARSDSALNVYPASLQSLVTNGYMASLPQDPRDYSYRYSPAGDYRSYELCAHLELEGTTDYCGGGNNCGGDCNYRVTNP